MVAARQFDRDQDQPTAVVPDPLAADHAELFQLQQPTLHGPWRKVAHAAQDAIRGRGPVFPPRGSLDRVERIPGDSTGQGGDGHPRLTTRRKD